MPFQIFGDITHVETFATSSSIREIARLRKTYGKGRWRKRKEIARSVWRTELSTALKCIGMRQPRSEGKN